VVSANREWWEPIKSGEYRRYYDASTPLGSLSVSVAALSPSWRSRCNSQSGGLNRLRPVEQLIDVRALAEREVV